LTGLLVVLAQLKTNTLVEDSGSERRQRAKPSRRRVSVSLAGEVLSLYESGLSTRDIARRTGLGKTTVLAKLREAGAELRPRGGR
jgi:DNA-binding CsgD family transcriptional regulator